ncbi:MAG: phosphate ABC transporter permease PtsA [Planctomycetota bacterium]|nr:MAG: phosphate ABC transporter permease PtsA [Planctomycetota bacterium]
MTKPQAGPSLGQFKPDRAGHMGLLVSAGTVLTVLLAAVLLFLLIFSRGARTFWPRDLNLVRHVDGRTFLAEVLDVREDGSVKMRTGNRDLDQERRDFFIFNEAEITLEAQPENAVWVERLEHGPVHAFFKAVRMPNAEGSDGEFSDSESLLVFQAQVAELRSQYAASQTQLGRMANAENDEGIRAAQQESSRIRAELTRYGMHVELPNGHAHEIDGEDVVKVIFPNQLGAQEKVGVWFGQLWSFITAGPRDNNTSGGVWPALIGTSLLVILMSVLVMPFGILAAVYLNEYAKASVWVNLVRIAVNNLAGVPSIVYGVFGLGFLIYGVGGFVDFIFFGEALPKPTIGTHCVLWASVTMALLTLPVVIVATEEGLRACPLPWREGALAMGATRWEMMRKVILPAARPGILTGLILAVSRAAGEVAPLMLTGVVNFAHDLPIDGTAPFVHLNRQFMHLGFHIYSVGFQAPNVEAAEPLVYSTAALLLLLILLLNLTAIRLRFRARKALEQ